MKSLIKEFLNSCPKLLLLILTFFLGCATTALYFYKSDHTSNAISSPQNGVGEDELRTKPKNDSIKQSILMDHIHFDTISIHNNAASKSAAKSGVKKDGARHHSDRLTNVSKKYTHKIKNKSIQSNKGNPNNNLLKDNMPSFGVIPTPSAQTEIPRLIFSTKKSNLSLDDVNNQLLVALKMNGYTDKSYFSVPGGFALVTHIEQIDKDGTSRPLPERFALQFKPYSEFSIYNYFRALLHAPVGYFRLIVFVVSNKAQNVSGQLNEESAKTKVIAGSPVLSSIKKYPFTDDYSCVAYIYEWEHTKAYANVRQLMPSDLPALNHLKKAGIAPLLNFN